MPSIDSHINVVTGLLNQVAHCNALVNSRTLAPAVKEGIKATTKDILDEVKDEVDLIKDEVDNW